MTPFSGGADSAAKTLGMVTTNQTHMPWEWRLNPGCRSEKCMYQPLCLPDSRVDIELT
ncbi:hypothetical protein DPMN_060957 [Dreissena polymorpha]|uniref:Uncharacterized protein n=1 Tax=Dreissena polymorpha TaxID=45954 RepID=A0A9D4HI13_DREPO|nr:hypothetical protein DPMN_060957 [Dreissena polymorpha]